MSTRKVSKLIQGVGFMEQTTEGCVYLIDACLSWACISEMYISQGRVSHGCAHIMGACLSWAYLLKGVHLMGTHLIAVYLIGKYLISVHLIGSISQQYLTGSISQACSSQACTSYGHNSCGMPFYTTPEFVSAYNKPLILCLPIQTSMEHESDDRIRCVQSHVLLWPRVRSNQQSHDVALQFSFCRLWRSMVSQSALP